jgi:hypothetical protein
MNKIEQDQRVQPVKRRKTDGNRGSSDSSG